MILRLIKGNNFILLLSLTFLGVLIHYPTFSLALYGDDWICLYRYFTHYAPFAQINTMLPGIFTYLAPYGPSIFLIGNEYRIFGNNYFFYYLVALIFKIFASFALFLVFKKITKSTLLSFLVATLFLGGFTGIQTTDWVFYSNVYLAVGLFFLGLLFQISFFEDKKRKNLLLHSIFSILAIVAAPVRLYPLVFIIPITDFILLGKDGFKNKKLILNKIAIFGLIITTLWLFGMFGGPWGKIYSPGDWSIMDFINFLVDKPYFTIKSFFYWIGTIFIPDSLNNNQIQVAFVGFGIVMISFFTAIKSKERIWVMLSGITFLIFLLTMWFFSPNRLIGSADRYLLPTFASGCFLIGILVKSLLNTSILPKYFGYLILVILIILHVSATRNIYSQWLLKGRDSEFINTIDKVILTDFKNPQEIIQPSKIYLDFDDGSIMQSVQFGLTFKIMIISKTYDLKYLPDVFNEKLVLINQVTKEKKEFNNGIFGYQYKNNVFKNITGEIRKELQ